MFLIFCIVKAFLYVVYCARTTKPSFSRDQSPFVALIICVQFINVGIILDVLLFGGRVLPFRSQTRSGPQASHSKPTQSKQKTTDAIKS